MADISTLVEDIEGLFRGHGFSDALERFSSDLGETFRKRFYEYGQSREGTLRLSNYGRPCLRQLWYEINGPKLNTDLPSSAKFKFLFGDVLESLLLLLADEAGHDVEDHQKEVSINGVVGHIDCIIDGVLVDVKSASTHSFNRFRSGGIRLEDPFGYIPQLAGYSAGLGGVDGAFLIVDKTLGNIHLERFSAEELKTYDPERRIRVVREALASPQEPERHYQDEPEGKSGNRKLSVACSYCSYNHTCWSDSNSGKGLRKFIYSYGPVYLTHVEKEPRVQEAGKDHG
jgi:hypothetical protein